MTQVLIIDPGLYLPVGHHLDYDRSVSKAFSELGYSAKIFCHRHVWDQIILNDAVATFTYNLYGKMPRSEFVDRLNIHVNELLSICQPLSEGDRLGFFPNAGVLDLLALRTTPSLVESFKSIHLVLRFGEINSAFESDDDSTAFFTESLRYLSATYDHIFLYTDTLALRRRWKDHGVTVQMIPLPIDPNLVFIPPLFSKRYQIASLGQTTPEKGLILVVNILLSLAANHIHPPAFVQTTFFDLPKDVKERLPNVNFNNSPLSRESYNDILHDSTFYLNLYDPTGNFKYGSSNTLMESVIAGCIPICTDYPFARSTLGTLFSRVSVSLDPFEVIERLMNLSFETSSGNSSGFSDDLSRTAKNLRELHSPKRLVECLVLNH